MRQLTFAIIAAAGIGAAGLVAGSGTAHADYLREGRWCAHMETGPGSVVERCTYNSLAACNREVVSGNRGFCSQNPRWAYGAAQQRERFRGERSYRR